MKQIIAASIIALAIVGHKGVTEYRDWQTVDLTVKYFCHPTWKWRYAKDHVAEAAPKRLAARAAAGCSEFRNSKN